MALIEAKVSGRRQALRELGEHPETGDTMVVMAGRYGPYVTDGRVNATLPKGTEPEALGVDEAVELLARAAARKASGRGKGRSAKGAKKKGKGSPGRGRSGKRS